MLRHSSTLNTSALCHFGILSSRVGALMAHSQRLSGMRPSGAVDRLEPLPVSVRIGGEKHQCFGGLCWMKTMGGGLVIRVSRKAD